MVTQTVACPGFILAGEEKKLGVQKKIQVRQNHA